MRVKKEGRGNNEKRAFPRRLHFKKAPKQPANKKEVERAVAALFHIKQELNREGEKRRRGKRGAPISGESQDKEVGEQNRQPTADSERKTRRERILAKDEEGTGRQIILQPGVRDHHEIAVEARAVIGIEESKPVPGFWDSELQNIGSESGGVAFIFPQIIAAKIGKDEERSDRRQDDDWPMWS